MGTHRAHVAVPYSAPAQETQAEAPLTTPRVLSIHVSSPTSHAVTERSETPDVVGLELVAAHRLARRHRLRLSVSVWETKIGPWGMILTQQPGGGRQQPGECIHVVVATRPHLAIPDVDGLEAGRAMRALRRFGLLPTRVEGRASRTVPAGHVITTRPRAGTLVADGEHVTVTISRARPSRGVAEEPVASNKETPRVERDPGSPRDPSRATLVPTRAG